MLQLSFELPLLGLIPNLHGIHLSFYLLELIGLIVVPLLAELAQLLYFPIQ